MLGIPGHTWVDSSGHNIQVIGSKCMLPSSTNVESEKRQQAWMTLRVSTGSPTDRDSKHNAYLSQGHCNFQTGLKDG